jgi:phosphoglycolate phosphatase
MGSNRKVTKPSNKRPRSTHISGVRKLVMLDFDGVIVDSLEVFCRVVPAILVEHGFPQLATREHILAFDDGNWFESLASASVPMSVARAIEDALATVVISDGSRPAPFEGVPEVVARLAERHCVVVITSSHSAMVEDFLLRHGINGVRGILGSDNDTSKVRKIDVARRVYGEGLDPWYIGDTVGDIIEGKTAGVGTIGAAWGWHSVARLRSVSPDHIAYSPNDLLALLCLDAPSP